MYGSFRDGLYANINVRTDYGRFRTRMFHPCGVTCAARKSGDPLGCLSKFEETPETAAHHLFNYVCLAHVGDQATTHKRQRARVDHATGSRDPGPDQRRPTAAGSAPRSRRVRQHGGWPLLLPPHAPLSSCDGPCVPSNSSRQQ